MTPPVETAFRAAVGGGSIVGSRTVDSGPPAILLHGGPSLSDYLDSLVPELAGAVTTARYQQRGLAPSLLHGPFDIDTHVADAVGVLDALGWERAWVVGHSWGGHLAMHLAVAHPDRLLGLVVLDALGAVDDGGAAALGPNLMAALSDADRARVEELDARDDRGEAEEAEQVEMMRILWPYYFGDPAGAPPMPALRFQQNGAETWASIRHHFTRRTLERGLPSLHVPVLITHGERSPIPLVEAERTAALMPAARLAVHAGRGHWAWLEEPGFVRALVEEMLSAD
ncbi:MAG TPA: alpha/beta hydrolase [Candidatus Limnocylindria bacterium]|nr:alpha/beta hydrolase [Candidatus Limnocylindria bacterium]